MTTATTETPIPKYSPWGKIDEPARVIAPGIVSVDTPSHGGFWLDDRRAQEMRDLFAYVPMNGWNWWEEDCEACLVVLAFPAEFGRAEVRRAIQFAEHWLTYRARRPQHFAANYPAPDDLLNTCLRWRGKFRSLRGLWRNKSARACEHWQWLHAQSDERYNRAVRLWRHLSRGLRLRGLWVKEGAAGLNFTEV